jgi:hypothetical protein
MKSFKEYFQIRENSISASSEDNEIDELLKQDPDTFDQTMAGWRSLKSNAKKIQAVEKYLKTYAPNDIWLPTTPPTKEIVSVPFMHWHLGQLYAMENNINKAIEHMRKSIGQDDPEWNDYVNATVMFLKKDREGFEKYANKENYNKKTIEKLKNNFDKTYEEAY